MKVFAIGPRDAAVPMAHVFAQADIRHYDQPGTPRFNGMNRLLNDAGLGVGPAGVLIFFARDAEEQNSLQSQVVGVLSFRGHLRERELKHAWHALDRLSRGQFFTDEQGENKIVRGEPRFPNEVSHPCAAAQSSRALNQFSHPPRLRVAR
jgi:hypothetical protein